MPEFIKFTKEILDRQPLSVLRAIGRKIGVKSPASLARGVLIASILKVQSGEIPPANPTKKGAPSKAIDLSKFYVTDEQRNFINEDFVYQLNHVNDTMCVKDETEFIVNGDFDYHQAGYGFLRNGELPCDVYVSQKNIAYFELRQWDNVTAKVKKNKNDGLILTDVVNVNGLSPEEYKDKLPFDKLTPYYPTEKICLEDGDNSDVSLRIIDLFSPMGFGQRSLIVAPPKSGKTTLLKNIALSIEKNHSNVKLIVLLIDERPEEETELKQVLRSEVVASTFDQSAKEHTLAVEKTLAKAKRLVEAGQDVIILMDSITKLARAYNAVVESSGRTLTGGLESEAIHLAKKAFGAARNVLDGGSLTIISTALVETGSRMDDVIYEEFKGTGNMEIHLSRELSERRIFPAIDLLRSGTRREDLLLSKDELSVAYKFRKLLADDKNATEKLISVIEKSKNNQEFVSKGESF